MSLGLLPLPMAAGPVIPTFQHASNCIVQNHQFCASWFFDNFSSRFEPRLFEHLALTGITIGIGLIAIFLGWPIAQAAWQAQRADGVLYALRTDKRVDRKETAAGGEVADAGSTTA